MESTRIIAIRHGETLWNTQSRIQGHIDIGLNERGQRQATLVGKAFAQSAEPVAAIYSSDLERARHTAEQVALATQLPLVQDARLRERHFGDFEGKTWSQIDEHSPEVSRKWRERDPQWRPGPGSESLLDLEQRVKLVVSDLASRHLGTQIVIVSHGGVMDMLYRWATGQDLQSPRTWGIENAVLNRLLWSESGLSLLSWGDNAHLEELSADDAAA
jgi:probable phosphoglycerate mutase